MATRLERYASRLFRGSNNAYSGFLGAYNMGVWGLSVSGKTPLEQGTLATGTPCTQTPRFTRTSFRNPIARNFVKYYDTPSIWGYGDTVGDGLYNSISYACTQLGLSMEEGLSERDVGRVKDYLRAHFSMG